MELQSDPVRETVNRSERVWVVVQSELFSGGAGVVGRRGASTMKDAERQELAAQRGERKRGVDQNEADYRLIKRELELERMRLDNALIGDQLKTEISRRVRPATAERSLVDVVGMALVYVAGVLSGCALFWVSLR